MNSNLTRTENGALQLRSSGNYCLDLFHEIGSARNMSMATPTRLEDLFLNAYAEDPAKAVAILYWVRAIREGAGERNVFHVLHKLLYGLSPNIVEANLHLLGELGYYKDYIRVMNDIPELEQAVVRLFAEGVCAGNHYACKWLPRKSKLYAQVRKRSGMDNKTFRKFVASHAATVEQQLCAGKLSEVDYSKIPSLAFNRYKRLFSRKDKERLVETIKKEGVNVDVLFPHQVFDSLDWGWGRCASISDTDKDIINAQWKSLPNYLGEGNKGILTVLDTSGSMFGGFYAKGAVIPAHVAFSLALYCAERVGAPFKNQVIEFSSRPKWIDLSAYETTADKMYALRRHNEIDTTNISAVFELILNTAVKHNLQADELPECILIMSDMQFDEGANYNVTLMDELKAQYKYHGYKFPQIVYWNLNATNTGVADNENCALISGFSPMILKSVLSSKIEDARKALDPVNIMNNAIEPIRAKLELSFIMPIPKALARRDFNSTRGSSARLAAILAED